MLVQLNKKTNEWIADLKSDTPKMIQRSHYLFTGITPNLYRSFK